MFAHPTLLLTSRSIACDFMIFCSLSCLTCSTTVVPLFHQMYQRVEVTFLLRHIFSSFFIFTCSNKCVWKQLLFVLMTMQSTSCAMLHLPRLMPQLYSLDQSAIKKMFSISSRVVFHILRQLLLLYSLDQPAFNTAVATLFHLIFRQLPPVMQISNHLYCCFS